MKSSKSSLSAIILALLVAASLVLMPSLPTAEAQVYAGVLLAPAAPSPDPLYPYVKDGDVWVTDVMGASYRQLTFDGRSSTPVLSPDGQLVAFLSIPAEFIGSAPSPQDVCIVSTSGSQPSYCLSDTPALRGRPVWSPSSSSVLYPEDGKLILSDLSGSRVELARGIARDGLDVAVLAWSPDASRVAYSIEGAAGPELWTIDPGSGMGGQTMVWPGGMLSDVSFDPTGQALTFINASDDGRLWTVSIDGQRMSSLVPSVSDVRSFAWSPNGDRIALLTRDGAVWTQSPEAPAPLKIGTSTQSELQWLPGAKGLLLSSSDNADLVVLSATGDSQLDLVRPAETANAEEPGIYAPLADLSVPYRYQGAADSGSCNSVNCGPTAVAMAIQKAKNQTVAISDIRSYISGTDCRWTNMNDIRSALARWGVSYTTVTGMTAVRDAVNQRGHMVIVPVVMSYIRTGSDSGVAYSDASGRYDRYYSYSSGHFVVVKGISGDGNWVIVHDPNVWSSGTYWYSNNTPKGQSRYYNYSGFASAFAANGNQAIEISTSSTPSSCTDGEGVVLYEHPNYQGRCTRFTGDDGNIGDNSIGNDAASSIKIIGNYEAQVFENGSYGGTSSRFTGDDPDFGNDAISHDRASSITVRRRDTTSNCDGNAGVYLYEHGNYSGRCSRFTGDSPNPGGWYIGNDAASSIKIVGSYQATLYEHDNYVGVSSTFLGDDSDFGNDTIGHDRTSSLRVSARPSGSSNCDGGQGVYLYEHSSYGGRCTKLTADATSPSGWYVGNDAASSIRFIGNFAATVYEHDNYNGASSSFTADDPDFGNDTIGHDRVSSVDVRIPTAGPTSCADGQFLAEYFNNRTLSGSPIFRRCESGVNYNWGGGGPGNGIPNDNFSVRWTGRFWFGNAGVYRFTTRTDDGVRLTVDGVGLVQEWRDMGATTFTRDQTLTAALHTVRMEYYENGGDAVAQLGWQFQTPSATDPDDNRDLSYGFGLDGTINPSRDRDTYYFDGSSGHVITLRMEKRNSTIDSYLELYNPDGSLLGQDDDNGGDTNARIAITLRQNGRHRVVAREYGTGTGGYRVSLSRESSGDPDDNRWIALGGNLQGTISPNSDNDWYYFSGTSGRSVSIRMNKIDSGLDPFIELYNPNGVRIAYNDDGGGNGNSWLLYTLPAGGTYRIKARSYNLSSSGRYELSLRSESNANLALNKPASASSTEFTGVEPYKAFDGNMSTRWSSRFSDPQLIYVNLGSVRTFNQVILKWEAAYARSYGIYYWNGSAWVRVFGTTSGNGGTDTINFAPVRAQYVGMNGTQRATSYGYSLWEFEVYDNTSLVLPLVPPDPEDKTPDTTEAAAPLAPNDDGKATLLLGEGPTGQEDTPLEGDPAAAPAVGIGTSIPSAFILYPVATENAADVPDQVLFQGTATDNDEEGASIAEYRWTSSIDGVIGTSDIFRLQRSQLSAGRHIITFEALDNEGDWSEPVTTVLVISDTPSHKLYLPFVGGGR